MNKPITMAALCLAMLAVAYFASSTMLEMAATITGLLSVWLTARENIWAWPIGLINVACFFYMFWDVKLYADMTLQVLFFGLIAIMASWLLDSIRWWTILVANLIAALAMGIYLWREHPSLRAELRKPLEEESYVG